MRRHLPAAVLPALLWLSAAMLPATSLAAQASDYCANHPEACAAAAERLQARCDADPAACAQVHERVEDLKARCAEDPAACEAKKQELRDRGQQLQDRCKADPDACEAQKQKLRERLKARRDRLAPAGETPPTIPPKPDR